ncbi:NADH-quinone oxidoreductase subunit N [Nocardioides aequoreus]|uniref:NADH-quinone oxidoreductase subunit N n=1 Tax=Nocardioides aequoreus TaxID=397278 RepID=UPI000AE5F0DB|nr:NADH-quinone oxidoreductase subunit N [Nocardioides aequoreus]
MAMRPLLLLPEMLLFVGGLAALISGSFLPRERQWVSRLVAAAALVACVVAAMIGLTSTAQTAFEGTFSVDTPTGVARIVAAVGTLIVLSLAVDEITGSPRESETYALLLFSTTGTLMLAGADDLLVLAVGFLLTSIPLYGLIGLRRTPAGAEAAMKTYLLGALFGILLLSGVTVLYGITGTTSYAALPDLLIDAPTGAMAAGVIGVLAGLMFKAGAVPGHFWIPDAAQGAGGAVAAFLTTVPKIGAVIATYRLVDMLPGTLNWPLLIAILAVASMTLGNLAAYWQTDPRRLLGWSTVSQVGYLLVPVAVAGRSDSALPSLLLYVAGYTLTNLAAFSVTTALPQRRTLESYGRLARAQPMLAAALVISLLGLVGTPPTIVFVGKLTIASAAWDGGLAWLAVAVFANTLISLFYYLRWIVPVFKSDADASPPRADEGASSSPRPASSVVAVVAALGSLAMGICAGLLLSLLTGT